MNYLAHAYLSFNDPSILVGNMISDFVKGKAKFGYPAAIQDGIMLHRQIDAFTDAHPATTDAKQIFRADYRLYAGAFIDVVYDHFLANDETVFTDSSLLRFTQTTYQQIGPFIELTPARFQHFFGYMKAQNWLYHYRFPQGIRNSMGGLVRRAAYLHEADTAFRLFQDHYIFLQDCYKRFFPDIKNFVREQLNPQR